VTWRITPLQEGILEPPLERTREETSRELTGVYSIQKKGVIANKNNKVGFFLSLA
jgi:hypothetical protein